MKVFFSRCYKFCVKSTIYNYAYNTAEMDCSIVVMSRGTKVSLSYEDKYLVSNPNSQASCSHRDAVSQLGKLPFLDSIFRVFFMLRERPLATPSCALLLPRLLLLFLGLIRTIFLAHCLCRFFSSISQYTRERKKDTSFVLLLLPLPYISCFSFFSSRHSQTKQLSPLLFFLSNRPPTFAVVAASTLSNTVDIFFLPFSELPASRGNSNYLLCTWIKIKSAPFNEV